VNWESGDLNVQLPVFSIHGNHDDPSGVCLKELRRAYLNLLQEGELAALDVVSMTGYLNYFGRSDSIDEIAVC